MNVARKGKATQSSTASSGGARARPSTATPAAPTPTAARRTPARGATNPWWEVDLGREVPIESIVVCNRTDGDLGTRLKDFTARRCSTPTSKTVFETTKNPAPKAKAEFAVGAASPERVVRRAAMLALAERPRPGGGRRSRRSPSSWPTTTTAPPRCRRCCASRPRDWPKDEAKAAARRPCWRTSASCRSTERTTPRVARRDAARRRARGAAAAGRGEGGAQGAGRARRARDPRRHAHRPDAVTTRSGWSCRPASRSSSCSRTPTSCRTTS